MSSLHLNFQDFEALVRTEDKTHILKIVCNYYQPQGTTFPHYIKILQSY